MDSQALKKDHSMKISILRVSGEFAPYLAFACAWRLKNMLAGSNSALPALQTAQFESSYKLAGMLLYRLSAIRRLEIKSRLVLARRLCASIIPLFIKCFFFGA
jgi:hypothetical protein